MKKLVFMFAAVVAMSFASCGQGANGGANDSDSVAADSQETVAPADSSDSAEVVAPADSANADSAQA